MGRSERKNHLADPGVEGRIILKWIFRSWVGGGLDWIVLAQDGDRWQALVNRNETSGSVKRGEFLD